VTDGTPRPWLPGEAASEADKRHAPATLRNRDAIADVLRAALPGRGTVLEVASGSGEHVVHFARTFPALDWQPSDPDPAALRSIAAWVGEADLPNVAPPLLLDASSEHWPVAGADAILCVNMVHISPWSATLGLLCGAARLLPPDGLLYLYGPYVQPGVETAPSNLDFDQSLRSRNPAWGLRNVADVEAAAVQEGLRLEGIVAMPANNLSLIFRNGPRPR
jgi:SAM-dependent methyltransferase